jgi:NTE family protein
VQDCCAFIVLPDDRLRICGCVATNSEPTPVESDKKIIIPGRPVVAFVLGGGAARGFAHVGVLQKLEENGISPDIVIGTSYGSVVGALYAGGIRGSALLEIAHQLSRDQLTDWVFPNRGVVRGQLLQQFINDALGHRPIEALGTKFVAVATELRNGRTVAFNAGDVGMAVRASSAIPGLIQPVTIDGVDYIDGGVVSPVPVHVARQYGADIVIAIDVSRPPLKQDELVSTFTVMHQALIIMTNKISAAETKEADILISPLLEDITLAEFDMREYAITRGEEAAEVAMPDIKYLIARLTAEKEKGRR